MVKCTYASLAHLGQVRCAELETEVRSYLEKKKEDHYGPT